MAFSQHLVPMLSPALSKNVVDALRDMISSGRLAPGEHLKEAEIATALGVSRGPVREAFVELSNEGFVELRRHRGAFVSTLTQQDIEEVYTLRLALERLAVERAVTRLTPDQLAQLDRVLDEMRSVDSGVSPERAVELDLAFHDVIYLAADHQRLQRSWRFIRSQVQFFLFARNVSHPDFLAVGYAEHRAVRDALTSGDVSLAIAEIDDHVNRAYGMLMRDQLEAE